MTQLEMMTSTHVLGQRDVFDFAFKKFDVLDAGFALDFRGRGRACRPSYRGRRLCL